VNADDPLIPPPDDVPVEPLAPSADPEKAAFRRAFDYVNMNAIAWPAMDAAGHMVPPPDEHVLDQLARTEELVPEEMQQVRPAADTVAVISSLHECDLCGAEARYDGRLQIEGKVIPAFACPDCYGRYGSGTLGAGGDVYLMTRSEVPLQVRAVCDELTSRLGRPSLWALRVTAAATLAGSLDLGQVLVDLAADR
jgi:hypothetical protein